MKILLAVVIVFFIIAIIVLLLLKKKQQAIDDEPVVPATILQKTQLSSQDVFGELTHSNTPTTDPLEKVEKFINDNRHDDAINELKRLLLSNPNNNVAILKLLQVYVLTNNLGAFDKVYQRLKENGDAQTLEQADSYRLLLDDVASEPIVAKKETKIDLLDFDIDSSQPTHHAEPTISNSVQAPESLSDFEDFNFDPTNTESTNPTQTTSDDEVFNLNFDTALSADELADDFVLEQPSNETSTPDTDNNLSFDTPSLDTSFNLDDFGLEENISASTSTPTSEPSLDDGFDLEFNLDTPSTKSEEPALTDDFALDDFDLSTPLSTETTSQATNSDELDFGNFDLNDFGTDKTDNTPQNDITKSTNNDFNLDSDDFGLSFDSQTTSEPTDNNTPSLDSLDNSLTDFNFDGSDLGNSNNPSLDGLSLDDINTPSTIANTDNQNNATTSEFSLDGFDFDDSIKTPQPTTANTTATSEFDLGDFSLEDTSPQVSEPATPAPITNRLDFDFDLAELANNTPSVTKTATETPADNTSTADSFPFELPPTQTTQTPTSNNAPMDGFEFLAQNKATPTERKLTSSFDLSDLMSSAPATNAPALDMSFVKGLDSAGITLDLAQQYMALGEYDSAKHLLEEVVTTGNAEQSRTASNLLKRLG